MNQHTKKGPGALQRDRGQAEGSSEENALVQERASHYITAPHWREQLAAQGIGLTEGGPARASSRRLRRAYAAMLRKRAKGVRK